MPKKSSSSVDSGKKKLVNGAKSKSTQKKLSIQKTTRNVGKAGASAALSIHKKKKIAFDENVLGSSYDKITDEEDKTYYEEGVNNKKKSGMEKPHLRSVRELKKRLQRQEEDDSDDNEDENNNHMLLLGNLREDENEDLQDVLLSSSEEDNLNDSDSDGNEFEKSHREGTKLSYSAIRFRFLPPEFEEPQLFKFLNQFGATVLNCFCVRSKRTFQSLGIAYAHFSNPDVLPIVKEECDGMLLGSRTVRARIVTLHRPMPKKEAVTKRRLLGRAYRDKGPPLHQFARPYKTNEVAALIKATRSEARNNHLLKSMGIDSRSTAFADQLAAVPKALLLGKKQAMVASLLKLAKENSSFEAKETTGAAVSNKNGEDTNEVAPSSLTFEEHKVRRALIHKALGRGTDRRKQRGSRRGKGGVWGKRANEVKPVKRENRKGLANSWNISSKKSATQNVKAKKAKKVRRSLKKKNRSKKVVE